MKTLRTLARYLVPLLPLLLVVLLTACTGIGDVDAPQNTFAPRGEFAREQKNLFLYAMWPALAIMILVEGALIAALIVFRHRRGRSLPKQLHGNPPIEVIWTLAPLFVLLGLAVPMVSMIIDHDRPPSANALPVKVTGIQWAWQFEYPTITDGQGKPLAILGTPERPAELHIPVGREVALELTASDVIHSFWVPRLAGKRDAIPGHTNHLLLVAEEPGTYPGQCAEYCGLLHADMRMIVVVHESEESFRAWAEQQLAAQAQSGQGQQQGPAR